MILNWECPHCHTTVRCEPVKEVFRDGIKVISSCECPMCHHITDVSVHIKDIIAIAEEKLFDKFGFSYN